ncbi:MAG: hypothetical protein KA764_05320 [Anaerolineales bacterium]|nr:hypothetical protein [Anaerolineales bacterium]
MTPSQSPTPQSCNTLGLSISQLQAMSLRELKELYLSLPSGSRERHLLENDLFKANKFVALLASLMADGLAAAPKNPTD